ncbi:hypothetical protein [Kineococcus rubinsiae]|uniref:hypothetical protein n=1 Tax=Kineococcus rubinsiae TaxID=2609562 RepID=UPI0014309E9F|nr:hypothetical protein [Kineococcus rubinsiae]NIZ92586.1 hypothetical protein [Kineococcus rubinsiae]
MPARLPAPRDGRHVVGSGGEVRLVLPAALHAVGAVGEAGDVGEAGEGGPGAAPVGGLLRQLATDEPGTRLELAALGSLDDGAGGLAHFTLSLATLAGGLPDVAALHGAGSPDAREVALPCGPAVVATSWEEVALPGLDATLLGRFEVHVAHPRPGEVLLLSIATTGVHVWDAASELAAAVACSLEFGAFAPGIDAEAAGATR